MDIILFKQAVQKTTVVSYTILIKNYNELKRISIKETFERKFVFLSENFPHKNIFPRQTSSISFLLGNTFNVTQIIRKKS